VNRAEQTELIARTPNTDCPACQARHDAAEWRRAWRVAEASGGDRAAHESAGRQAIAAAGQP